METENTPIEHQNVPTAHQGLHSFLYSSDNEHDTDTVIPNIESDGTSIVDAALWQEQNDKIKLAGVYAVLDCDRTYQYIGYSRDVLRSFKAHMTQHSSETCAFIRVKTFKFPKRQAMETLKEEWIAELGYTPSGNQGGQSTWASTIGEAAKATMSQAEKDAYEDKKLKLRKAMADATLTDELEKQETQTLESVARRQKLESAVKNDDWSSIIESQ